MLGSYRVKVVKKRWCQYSQWTFSINSFQKLHFFNVINDNNLHISNLQSLWTYEYISSVSTEQIYYLHRCWCCFPQVWVSVDRFCEGGWSYNCTRCDHVNRCVESKEGGILGRGHQPPTTLQPGVIPALDLVPQRWPPANGWLKVCFPE